jgi:putative acetyltransferase
VSHLKKALEQGFNLNFWREMNIQIIPLTIEAYEHVFALWQQCEGIGLSEADSKESIRAYLLRNPEMSFIATAEGAVVGAILCGHDGRRGYIYHLAVHRRYRRQSVGRQLVNRCLGALHRVSIQKCHIFILNGNREGMAFWKAVGWTRRRDISVISKNIEPLGATKAASPSR